ncbi:MAG: efflux RND transporter permease subunit [Vicinamibacterales bacterium]|jgi:multidrug efflux pump subunit AcrB|nr:acriflavin resistance protein [Acidobacteriota bacterium]MDP6373187.1 efflux RND transporter permease subunit [Vicinamibacterales bacterium]MDP6610161.1 efflux RND transporter permease subunit [Vicinamibacterales bacterium]HAK56310.1 AcrB/AcrD/AcrF family protein [Acidobacteriota bacterium]|tara:strand:- start:9160 stop:12384 length:3225 start_codon:yes stop_codon:yes gene_type:complete
MKGAVDWFAHNSVAANLLMVLIVAGGLFTAVTIKREVFPEFSLDMITVQVPYRGAAPEEVEEGVCVRVEEAIQGLDGIKRITSTASEGSGMVTIELEAGADVREVLDDVKSRVDAIETFPEETEKPIIQEITNRQQVINVAVHGQLDEVSLKSLAEQVRDDLSALPEITQVELANARPYEISIEVSEMLLRRHGLTFDEVAQAVRRSSLDLPGGSVKTEGGEFLLRTKGQAYRGHEFESLVLITRSDGSHLALGDVATIVDGFEDTDQASRFEGDPALVIQVYRTGEQSAIDVSDAVHAYVETASARMPAGVSLTTLGDQASVLKDRLNLLVRNGLTGFALVFIVLTLFLRFSLAFWVSLGIPISFLGALWLLPGFDVSVNMMSLFAFIVVLGIVVDDAIIVGENIYTHQQRHGDRLRGAIEGTQEVATPVIFAVLTSVAAFAPLLFVPGMMGKMMVVMPLVVIPCLLFSLVESQLILPAHLSHGTMRPPRDTWGERMRSRIDGGVKRFVDQVYRPSLEAGIRMRYLTVAVAIATLVLTAGLVGGGWVRVVFMAPVDADFLSASVTMPQGTPVEVTEAAVQHMEDAAETLRAQVKAETGRELFKYTYGLVGSGAPRLSGGMGPGARAAAASHLGGIFIELTNADERGIGSAEVSNRWRELVGTIPDAVEVKFDAELFMAGDPVNVQLTGADIDELRAAGDAVKARLAEYAGVYDIADSFREGKQEIKLGIEPTAEVLGLTLQDLGRQVRQAFYGEEAQRIQRGRDDVRVMVRYPESERRSVGDLENMRIRTPDGQEVPFSQVARVEPGRGFASIKRVDRQRALNVTAAVDQAITTPGDVVADLDTRVLPELLLGFPGVRHSFEGQQTEFRDSTGGLAQGFMVALMLIYLLLAVPLKSYAQPLIIMSAIPFGLVGATWGHLIMGMDISLLSMFGLVALAGVVVNDSLVMVDFINRFRRKAGSLARAVREAGAARFRPILLTSLTTFFGLLPLMLETSLQAQFLIPMAISLAFGVIFSTFITLMLVPAGYIIIEDLKGLLGGTAHDVDAIETEPEKGSVAAPALTGTEVATGLSAH